MATRTATLTLARSTAYTPGTPGAPAIRLVAPASSHVQSRLAPLPSMVVPHARSPKTVFAIVILAPSTASYLVGLRTAHAPKLVVLPGPKRGPAVS